MYFEALYNENRNAIPSWQGYNYQGEVAAYKYLNYILQKFQEEHENLNSIHLKIEWMEDFAIFEDKIVKQIYQVKKTLNKSTYQDVIKNFIFQFKLIEDNLCEWFIVYDGVTNTGLESISKERFNEIFDTYINGEIIRELDLLKEQSCNISFWKEHLKLLNGSSKLKKVRGFIRRVLENDSVQFSNLRVEDCKKFIDNHFNKLFESLKKTDEDYYKFNNQVKFEKIELNSVKSRATNIINKLAINDHIRKNDIMQSEDIFILIYDRLHEELMKIRNKKSELFTIIFQDIQDIFLSSDKILALYKDQVHEAFKEMNKIIIDYCKQCDSNNCIKCEVTNFLNLDFCKLIDHCNLEYPKVKPDQISVSLRNKLSSGKNIHLAEIITKYKEGINCIEKDNFVEISKNNRKLFVSQNILDNDDYNIACLIKNMNEHLDVYNEYSYILTKYFSDLIDPEHAKIVKNTEFADDKPPTFMEVLPITFKCKEYLEEL